MRTLFKSLSFDIALDDAQSDSSRCLQHDFFASAFLRSVFTLNKIVCSNRISWEKFSIHPMSNLVKRELDFASARNGKFFFFERGGTLHRLHSGLI